MKKITLKVFVVPNAAVCYDGCSGNGPVGDPTGAYICKLFADSVYAAKRMGFDVFGFEKGAREITTSDMWVQVWIHDDQNDNFTDHGIPKGHPLYGVVKYAPKELPAMYLTKIAKGGFTTVIKYDRYGELLEEPIEITWVSSQETTRYRSFGSMEQALNHALARSEYYVKPFAKEKYQEYKNALK